MYLYLEREELILCSWSYSTLLDHSQSRLYAHFNNIYLYAHVDDIWLWSFMQSQLAIDFVSVSVSLWNNDHRVAQSFAKMMKSCDNYTSKQCYTSDWYFIKTSGGPGRRWLHLGLHLFCSNSFSERLGCENTKFINTYEEVVCSRGNSFSRSRPAQCPPQWTALVRPFNLHLYWTDSPSSNYRQAAFSDIQMSC